MFLQWAFTYIRLVLSTKLFIGTTRSTSLRHNIIIIIIIIIINIIQINYLLHLLLDTIRQGRPVPFTLQLGLQEGMTLEQYSKGSCTPISAHPLGTHPQGCPYLQLTALHRRTTLTSAQPLGSRSPMLVHKHVHPIDLLLHCITQEIHMDFIINSLLKGV